MGDDLSEAEEIRGLTSLLSKPSLGETLYLYLAVSESAISGALVREDKGVQKPLYYVNDT